MSQHVAIVGAGIVGVCSALWLQKAGYQVTLIDRDEPGHGASFGNACSLTDFNFMPIAAPGILKELPRLLFDKNSPLKLSYSYLPKIFPWLIQFLYSSRKSIFEKNTKILGELCQRIWEGYGPLVELTGSEDLIQRDGFLYLFDSEKSLLKNEKAAAFQKEAGVEFEAWGKEKIKEAEPYLAEKYYAAHFYPNTTNVKDPSVLIERFVKKFLKQGGKLMKQNVKTILVNEKISLGFENQGSLLADKLVIAAGAWSKNLCQQLDDRFLLDTERGYHVMYQLEKPLVSRPVMSANPRFCLIPMLDNRLRVTSIDELAGLKAPPTQACIEQVIRHGKALLPQLGDPTSTWLGFRPSMPDSVPIIQRASSHQNVVYAFGHAHLGLTLGGLTGKLVAEILTS